MHEARHSSSSFRAKSRNPVARLNVIPRDPSTPLRSVQDDPGSLIINTIHLPSCPCRGIAWRRLVRLVTTNQFTTFQLQIPLRTRPRFFVPPVSRKQIRTAFIDN